MCPDTPIACSLTPERTLERTNLAKKIGSLHLIEVETDGANATLAFKTGLETREELERFTALESECCPFFEFKISESQEIVELAIGAPVEGIAMTRGLVAGFTSGWDLSNV